MANESGELPMTPEVTNSPGVEKRRHLPDKASSGSSVEKVVPNYLRASTGSCHDFCKYGKKHAHEVKERRSIPDRATRKQLHQSLQGSVGGITVSVARLSASVDSKLTKISTRKLKESVDSKMVSDTSDTPKQKRPTKSFDNPKESRNEVTVNRRKSTLAKVNPSLLRCHTSPPIRLEISSMKEVQSPSKSASKKVGTPSKSISRKVDSPSKPTSRKVEAQSKSTSRKVEAPSGSMANKMDSPLKPTFNEMRNPSKPISKVKTSSKPSSNVVKTSSQISSLKGKEANLFEKRLPSLNLSNVRRKQISSMNTPDVDVGQIYNKIKLEKGATSSKAGSKKLMAPQKALLSPRASLRRVASLNSRKLKSLKIASHLKHQQTPKKVEHEEHDNNNNNEVEEKTLYVIKMESENKPLQSDQNASYDDESYIPQLLSPKSSVSSISESFSAKDREESEYTTSEYEQNEQDEQDSFSGSHEVECIEKEKTLEDEKKSKNTKNVVAYSKNKDNKVVKLKFRRGKVVENPTEISSPRRIKFRRGKVLGGRASVKVDTRKSFERHESCADSNGATTAPEKVILRHQDMQDKRDAQGLFNNVIEETASKLAETRKSKVKALVGAFETVISLQEKKPSVNTLS
ncbi:probable replication factor C subunit 1 [Vigna unguiculata]|uniref:Calmodulin-binding domain-containing protein n=1 Tax=Vigna unguiculata TaxID=3917 RepID=A0A4D6LW53_VIGUN|nr:probable replication factor C subunit 1 [Vigna unguiculata]XP_027925027.1 probable replication factor C subunit 1 [Vigna unguiculata]XP_027925028.1 probable replication factor C subunit 1 [Vigna unguiculata]QCD92661.1 hypothetical protein DEO72_LG5g729 [Vigna unguiculata]